MSGLQSVVDALLGSTGQDRRAWLDRQDQRLTEGLNYYLGPAAQPLTSAAQLGAILSPGQDFADMHEFSGELMRSPNVASAAENAGWLGAAALGAVLPGSAGAVRRAVDEAPQGIRAYHGSPHDFDRFDLSKIGTGEGAQAYGHGLYFAENEGVARQYREKLAERPQVRVGGEPIQLRGDIFSPASADATVAARLSSARHQQGVLTGAGAEPETIAREVMADIEQSIEMAVSRGDFDLYRSLSDQKTALARFMERGIEFDRPGRMYEVNINADPEDFLDWDRPLSEQSERVRGALGYSDDIGSRLDAKKAEMERLASDRDPVTNRMRDEAAWHRLARERDDLAAMAFSGDSGGNAYGAFSRGFPGGREQATPALREAGIPGIRYLDQGSRGAGDGTRNYVVFDDSMIDILRKYGLLPLMFGGGLAAGGSTDTPAAPGL